MANITITNTSIRVMNNTLIVNYTTDLDLVKVELTKDDTNYITASTYSQTSATFNISSWPDGTYSSCKLRLTYKMVGDYASTVLNMQYASAHEAIPNISGADWTNAPRAGKASTIPIQNCDDCASGTHTANEDYSAGSLWSAFTQWTTVYKIAGCNLVENVGVEITDFKMWRYDTSANTWVLVNEGFDYGAFYLEDFWDDGNSQFDDHKELSSDSKTYKCLMDNDVSGRCFHPFSPQIGWADVGFSNNTNPSYIVAQVKARLIVWDNSKADNRSNANLCINTGGDYWIRQGTVFDSQWRHSSDMMIGYFKKITNDWQYSYMTTCPSNWDKGFPCVNETVSDTSFTVNVDRSTVAITVSDNPNTSNNVLTVYFNTNVLTSITNVQLSKDGGASYIDPI